MINKKELLVSENTIPSGCYLCSGPDLKIGMMICSFGWIGTVNLEVINNAILDQYDTNYISNYYFITSVEKINNFITIKYDIKSCYSIFENEKVCILKTNPYSNGI